MDRKRNYRRFLLLWAGELVSSIGSGLTSFGLGVYVFRQTGSAADMALVSLLPFCRRCCSAFRPACWRTAMTGGC